MIDNKKVLAIISARGGSKGVPRKNIRNLAGKPLIAWTIEVAKKSQYIDRLILSSEDDEIIKIAKEYGCEVPFVRPRELAQDNTSGIEPILHAVENIEGYDYVVLLQPTSPLRIAEDIDGCLENLTETNSAACVSVTESNTSPFWMYTLSEKKIIQPLIKQDELIMLRQELPKVFALNGAVYVAKIEWIKRSRSFLTEETSAYNMPQSRSYDIDTEDDFLWCDLLMKNLLGI
ncbi:cytidylyltransferase domain-containing protein [Psychrobacillus psychrotolerans]|uniref:acylneuraminate cytidylyltransferase family protein n=1 Tax=Psychrobacillus psychrotolerans TaxID=126156 RepID=UPI003C7651C0